MVAAGQVAACCQRHEALRVRGRVENGEGLPVAMGRVGWVLLSVSVGQTWEVSVGRGIRRLVDGEVLEH